MLVKLDMIDLHLTRKSIIIEPIIISGNLATFREASIKMEPNLRPKLMSFNSSIVELLES